MAPIGEFLNKINPFGQPTPPRWEKRFIRNEGDSHMVPLLCLMVMNAKSFPANRWPVPGCASKSIPAPYAPEQCPPGRIRRWEFRHAPERRHHRSNRLLWVGFDWPDPVVA